MSNTENNDMVIEDPPPRREKEVEQLPRSFHFFDVMARRPWPFLLVLPVLFAVFAGVGWSRDDKVESDLDNLWTPTSGVLQDNKDYVDSLGVVPQTSSSYAAMAIARDGGNLFTESRLEEIRQRMDVLDAATVVYKGETFTWQDLCSVNSLGAGTGTTYRFPCARLSPMDLFQETRSYFDEIDRVTWYQGVVHTAAVRPRILRLGILQQSCVTQTPPAPSNACDETYKLRNNVTAAQNAGYPPEYANPMGLIADVGNLELNHPCRICIEQGLDATMTQLQYGLIVPLFTVLSMEFQRYQQYLIEQGTASTADIEAVGELAAKSANIAATVDRRAVEDFYYYQVLRKSYGTLGAEDYIKYYEQMCTKLPCPTQTVTLEQAEQALLRHADNIFSSITTAGSPFPFWSEGDGTGDLLAGNSPVGGSGVDMSENIYSAVVYLDLTNIGNLTAWKPIYSNGFADPSDPLWNAMMETNPVYAWFMAGETEMTAHCANGNLTGTNTGDVDLDETTAAMASANLTQYWCTKYNEPFEMDATFTKQHFARMWYDLLLDSEKFLGVTQGEDDPYTWTLGAGCGYTMGGERDPYHGKNEKDILGDASRELYFVDEGASLGVVDRNLLFGDVTPRVGEWNFSNPLEHVGMVQSLYSAMMQPKDIQSRVSNCNRPGGPVTITEEDAEEILTKMKEEFDDVWSEGWDNETAGEVQFVSFFDSDGGTGTFERFLNDITLGNGKLTAISIVIIGIFSIFLMFSFDPVESQVGITFVGVGLVVLAYFSAVGFAVICGIKINITTAWTLPFIMLGLGIDDIYIVLLAVKKQKDCSEPSFKNAMNEVIAPITMTSLVNASMFAIMNISDVPAVYYVARVALTAVCFLYLVVVVCFSAYCLLDMRRRDAHQRDVFRCCQSVEEVDEEHTEDKKSIGTWVASLLFERMFRPSVLGGNKIVKTVSHLVIWLCAGAFLGVAIYGLVEEKHVGLGVREFFASDMQAGRWAESTESLATWAFGMNWGSLNYTDPTTQMKMIRQFENVVEHPMVAEVDTKQLWMADFAVWTTRQCDANVIQLNSCGMDQVFPDDNTTCTGTWSRNLFDLREKIFTDGVACSPYEGGICRPTSQMHPVDLLELGVNPTDPGVDNATVWCPVFEWTNDKLAFCLQKWRLLTGGDGSFVLRDEHGSNTTCSGEHYNDERVKVPIPYSAAPPMFAFDLLTHEATVEFIEETRQYCDYDPELQCFLSGIPYDFWTQYVDIDSTLVQVACSSLAVGFVVSALFLLAKLTASGHHGHVKILLGSLAGALLISTTTSLSLVVTIGLSYLSGVRLTGFSLMSFVLSVGFAVEYSVHIVARWLRADMSYTTAVDRVDYAMSFLMLPMFMSFVSSLIGVACLGFTEFEFIDVYFFRPLIIVVPITYFFGCWWLPALLSILDMDVMKLGKPVEGVCGKPAEVSVGAEEPGHEATATDTKGHDLVGTSMEVDDEIAC